MITRTGRYAMFEQFLADGITFMFGNPGTSEQGFLDAVDDFAEMKYILALQETIAVAMADGHARVTKKPTVVQLHAGVGLGNGIGMMYQAMRGHAPLVVLSGEAGIRYDAMDAQMYADEVAMAEPVTKWATRVVDPSSVLRVLRRAIKMAATPPMGPVFVDLPMDILDAPNDEDVVPTSFPQTRVLPEQDLIDQAASLLIGARKPLILMGDGIAYSYAQDELVQVAEALGAEVWGVDNSEVNMSYLHPLYKGSTGHMFGSTSHKITADADAILIVGTYVFPEVFPALSDVWPKDAKVVHIDLDAYEIAKNFPITLGLVADPKPTLAALARSLDAQMSARQKDEARVRLKTIGQAKEQAQAAQIEKDQAVRDSVPLHASAFFEELAKHVPQDVIIFDDALQSSPPLTRYLPPTLPDHFFQIRGGSLGLGIPGALGIKLARPDKTVISVSGDGGSMYTIQALWTAAHHNIGAKFIICNNQSYMLLKENILQYWRERGIEEHEFPSSFNLIDPVINFSGIANALGVEAARVERPEEIGPAIRQMFEHDGPFLIDLVISNEVAGSKIPAMATRAKVY
jgi:thiamine pyrophosphate-dependent acetolactate synthase large subunit-like protein